MQTQPYRALYFGMKNPVRAFGDNISVVAYHSNFRIEMEVYVIRRCGCADLVENTTAL